MIDNLKMRFDQTNNLNIQPIARIINLRKFVLYFQQLLTQTEITHVNYTNKRIAYENIFTKCRS